MGYTTDFEGRFEVTPPLTPEDKEWLDKFSYSRRMARDIDGFGVEGEFYVDGTDSFGSNKDGNIIDYNRPPASQPGLWCQWAPNEDGTAIEWDGGEKFYEYIDWIKYLITHVLDPKGPWGTEPILSQRYVLNGDVEWIGEDPNDRGVIRVEENKVSLLEAVITYVKRDK